MVEKDKTKVLGLCIIMSEENASSEYFPRLAATFTTEKLELIQTICWVLSHSESGQVELNQACNAEWQKRKNPPKLNHKEAI